MICYEGKFSELLLSAFYDAEWGNNKGNRCSTSKVVVMIDILVYFQVRRIRTLGTFIVHSRSIVDKGSVDGDEDQN